MAEENRDLSALVALIAKLKIKTDAKLRTTIREIINLSYQYPYHNKQFTFDKDKTLEDNVNKLLIDLTDSIINDIDDYSAQSQAIAKNEEDNDLIISFIHQEINGEDLTQRLDKHMTRLKNSLEAFVAIGFANFLTESDLYNAFLRNIRNPFAWHYMQEAYKDPLYEAISIKEKGFAVGKYIDRDIEKAIGLVISGALIGSYDYALQLRYQREGAIGWTTMRGSTYDCALCDSMVGAFHPMTEIFYGWHPRCLCILTPIFAE